MAYLLHHFWFSKPNCVSIYGPTKLVYPLQYEHLIEISHRSNLGHKKTLKFCQYCMECSIIERLSFKSLFCSKTRTGFLGGVYNLSKFLQSLLICKRGRLRSSGNPINSYVRLDKTNNKGCFYFAQTPQIPQTARARLVHLGPRS
jgi:hypothetical protein